MLQRLAADARAMFVLDAAGRIVRENDPDGSTGPRFAMLSCAEGALAFVRQDVPDPLAAELARTVAEGATWADPDVLPAILERLTSLLAPAEAGETSLVFALPHQRPVAGVEIVRSGTDGGARLLARLARDGLPAHLVEAGFVSLADFWAPWCAVIEAGEIAALAFAARLGEAAAEIGVYTFPRWRGRGLAAAATAAWSAAPELAGRALFYSTHLGNTSSQRVAARLGLERIGLGLRIA